MNNFNQNNFKADLKDTNFNKIGVITLSTDFTIEQDYRKICQNLPVDIFFNRIPFIIKNVNVMGNIVVIWPSSYKRGLSPLF